MAKVTREMVENTGMWMSYLSCSSLMHLPS